MLEEEEEDKEIKILVVEDEVIIGHTMTGRLKQLGFSPIGFVDSGEKALEEIEKTVLIW